MDTVLRSDNNTFLLHRDQSEKCTDATPPTRGNNELESKFFQRCSCCRVPPGGPCQQLLPTQRGPTETLGKNREPCCRDNEQCEIVGTYVCKVRIATGNSLGARNSELDPRLAGFPLTMAFCCFYSAGTFST